MSPADPTDDPREGPVLVVDFGAQYAQLIARRVREAHVYSRDRPAHRHGRRAGRPPARRASSSRGARSRSTRRPRPPIDPAVYELGVPILGICYGAQLLAQQLGGGRRPAPVGASTAAPPLTVTGSSPLFADWPESCEVWMSHGDAITEAPDGFVATATSPDAPVAALHDPERGIFGVQFHPEVVHTEHGRELLERFLYDICHCPPSWTHTSIIESQVAAVRAQVGTSPVLCALSGGVDSAVAAALVHKAIGEQLTCVYVDTGLMRANESEQVEETFRRQFHIDLVHVKAADRFFEALAGVTDPETQAQDHRRALHPHLRGGRPRPGGREGAPGRRSDAPDDEPAGYLVQGTLYPDVIESGSGTAATIKSPPQRRRPARGPRLRPGRAAAPAVQGRGPRRRRGAGPARRDRLAPALPRPRPGRAHRRRGDPPSGPRSCGPPTPSWSRRSARPGLYRELWQSFAVLPAVRTVGVMGDGRTYAYPVVIRAVTSDDAMTADWARLPYDLLERLSSRIINEVEGVNRVALDITSKPPGTIEWE